MGKKTFVTGMGLLLVCAVTVGCESLGNPSFKKMFGPVYYMDSWVGKHRDELVSSKDWGAPSEDKPSENGVQGGRTLVYARGYKMPGQHFKYEQDCRMMFHADAQGVIKSWSYQGC